MNPARKKRSAWNNLFLLGNSYYTEKEFLFFIRLSPLTCVVSVTLSKYLFQFSMPYFLNPIFFCFRSELRKAICNKGEICQQVANMRRLGVQTRSFPYIATLNEIYLFIFERSLLFAFSLLFQHHKVLFLALLLICCASEWILTLGLSCRLFAIRTPFLYR